MTSLRDGSLMKMAQTVVTISSGGEVAKEQRTALQPANAIRDQLGRNGAELKIGVFFDKATGWRARVYGNDATRQQSVDTIARDLRQQFDLDEG
jgi:hypothetical protein